MKNNNPHAANLVDNINYSAKFSFVQEAGRLGVINWERSKLGDKI